MFSTMLAIALLGQSYTVTTTITPWNIVVSEPVVTVVRESPSTTVYEVVVDDPVVYSSPVIMSGYYRRGLFRGPGLFGGPGLFHRKHYDSRTIYLP